MVENKGQLSSDDGNSRGLEATWRGPATRELQSPNNRIEKALFVVESWRWKRHMNCIVQKMKACSDAA